MTFFTLQTRCFWKHIILATSSGWPPLANLVLSYRWVTFGLDCSSWHTKLRPLWLLEHLHSASNMYVICREGPPTSCLSDPLPPLINVPIPSAFLFSLTLHTHYCRKDPHVVLRMAPNAFSDEFGDTSSDSPYLVTNLVMNFVNFQNMWTKRLRELSNLVINLVKISRFIGILLTLRNTPLKYVSVPLRIWQLNKLDLCQILIVFIVFNCTICSQQCCAEKLQ